jgi:CRP-like cAMP-binding protein
LRKIFEAPTIFTCCGEGGWFDGLPESLAITLFSAVGFSNTPPGKVIYLEDTFPQSFFAALDGAVHFGTVGRSGRRVLLHAGSTGTWFGELPVIAKLHTFVTVRAFRSTQVWRCLALP